ncbi:histidine kinase osmosensor [Marasmius sp. AFHP31]|nr:histidine kinase osmosensor [Marasmius sp. AFHP31]
MESGLSAVEELRLLKAQVQDVARVCKAVADGDLSQKITVPVQGMVMVTLKDVINTMVDKLGQFAKEVTRVSQEVGMEGKLRGQALVLDVEGTWRELTGVVNKLAANLTSQVCSIAKVTKAVALGDLSKQIEVNGMVVRLCALAAEVTRVTLEVGSQGKLGGQANVPDVEGVWFELVRNVNRMCSSITDQVRSIAIVTTAVAGGDLTQKIEMQVEGEVATLKKTVNNMVDQLGAFVSEVTRVALEVCTQGILGGQARVEGVQGTWADLTRNVNKMASNLTNQVRSISEVTKAITQGNLSKFVEVDVQGEMLDLKETVNSMVSQLSTFSNEVTCVSLEVGTEGILGGQAFVPDVQGEWKSLTDNVNLMAMNLTNQVHSIAEVTKAVASGDLTKKIVIDVKGEIDALKETVNEMTESLSVFTDEVTRVACEVGTEGKLGGQARAANVAGTWKALTDNVNVMANNLTLQVRTIAVPTTAVAQGDLTQKIVGVSVSGEMLNLVNVKPVLEKMKEIREAPKESDTAEEGTSKPFLFTGLSGPTVSDKENEVVPQFGLSIPPPLSSSSLLPLPPPYTSPGTPSPSVWSPSTTSPVLSETQVRDDAYPTETHIDISPQSGRSGVSGEMAGDLLSVREIDQVPNGTCTTRQGKQSMRRRRRRCPRNGLVLINESIVVERPYVDEFSDSEEDEGDKEPVRAKKGEGNKEKKGSRTYKPKYTDNDFVRWIVDQTKKQNIDPKAGETFILTYDLLQHAKEPLSRHPWLDYLAQALVACTAEGLALSTNQDTMAGTIRRIRHGEALERSVSFLNIMAYIEFRMRVESSWRQEKRDCNVWSSFQGHSHQEATTQTPTVPAISYLVSGTAVMIAPATLPQTDTEESDEDVIDSDEDVVTIPTNFDPEARCNNTFPCGKDNESRTNWTLERRRVVPDVSYHPDNIEDFVRVVKENLETGFRTDTDKYTYYDPNIFKNWMFKVLDVKKRTIAFFGGTVLSAFMEGVMTVVKDIIPELIDVNTASNPQQKYQFCHMGMWNRYHTNGEKAPVDGNPHKLRKEGLTRGAEVSQFTPRISSEIYGQEKRYSTLMMVMEPIFEYLRKEVEKHFPTDYVKLEAFVQALPMHIASPFHPFSGGALNVNCATKAHKDGMDYLGRCLYLLIHECTGGKLVLEEAGLVIRYNSGDFIIFDSETITHYNLDFKGMRISFALSTDKAAAQWVKDRNGWILNIYMRVSK